MAPFAGFTKVNEHHGVVHGYILNQKIGQGNFGEVFACPTPNGRVVAVKKMPKVRGTCTFSTRRGDCTLPAPCTLPARVGEGPCLPPTPSI